MAASGKPTLHYFDVNGRGELSKLIAAVGGVDLDIKDYPFQVNGSSFGEKASKPAVDSEHLRAAAEMDMAGCGLPILIHGDLKICQSFAVQDYLATIGPNYPNVSPQQKAIDSMFEGYLEDAMGVGAGVILSGGDPAGMPKAMDKIMGILDKYIPESGFVNGFEGPTRADLVILILTQALIPFAATLGEYDWDARAPKAKALGERTAASPAVAAWLTNEQCYLKLPPKADRK